MNYVYYNLIITFQNKIKKKQNNSMIEKSREEKMNFLF